MGHVSVESKCPSEKDIKVEIVKNNDIVSFVSEIENLSYKISNNDDFGGSWEKSEGKNVVISSYNSGMNYIWFKDDNGNLSEVYDFNVECLDSNGEEYDPEIFYCKGSKVTLDNKKWLV
jgi:hypothetical protein